MTNPSEERLGSGSSAESGSPRLPSRLVSGFRGVMSKSGPGTRLFFGGPKYVLRVSRVTACVRGTRSVRGSPTALGPAFPEMSQARDSEEIRRAIPGLFACDLAGQTNSGSHHAREETLRCMAVVNSATRPLTLLGKKVPDRYGVLIASHGNGQGI